MKVEPIIHVIVGAAEWGHDRLRYRRHRLAEFLARQKETKSVIWVCPSPRANDGQMAGIAEGIRQFTVKDLMRQKLSASAGIQTCATGISFHHW